MATEKQHVANRANAKASTGPKSKPGRAIARLNALTHGAFATQRLLPGEDASEYERLSTTVSIEIEPKTAIESMLVDQIIADMWRLRRIEHAELVFFERLQRSNYENTLKRLPQEEFEVVESTIDDEELLYIVRRNWRRHRMWIGEEEDPLYECEESDSDVGPRFTSSEREIISNIVKRRLDQSNDSGTLLLEAMTSQQQPMYSTLESMRRKLERDIVRRYSTLLALREGRQTIEPARMK